MLETYPVDQILFLDIETVPAVPSFKELNADFQRLWDRKSSHFRKDNETAEDVYSRAGIYAEFGKIICISVAHLSVKEGKRIARIKSFYGDDEAELLRKFQQLLNRFSQNRQIFLCAHNGKEFDFPYIARRMLVNGITLPAVLDVSGKKPWEVNFLDTMEMWRFGDFKSFTSLDLLAHLFGIPTPKDDIDGSQVGHVYWQMHDLQRIVVYCEKDVLAVVQLFLRYKGEPLLAEEEIERVSENSAEC